MNETDGFFTVDTKTGKALVKASAVTAVVTTPMTNGITGITDPECTLHLQGTYLRSTEKADIVADRWQSATDVANVSQRLWSEWMSSGSSSQLDYEIDLQEDIAEELHRRFGLDKAVTTATAAESCQRSTDNKAL